jgi:hypothetical protein
LNKDILGPEAGCSPGKIILVPMTLNKIFLSFYLLSAIVDSRGLVAKSGFWARCILVDFGQESAGSCGC